MFLDKMKDNSENEKIYTNNPDYEIYSNNPNGAIYTNNPDDEENLNPKKNELFFKDDDVEIKNKEITNEKIKENNNTNPEIKKDEITMNKDNNNNEIIEEDNKDNDVEIKKLINNNEIKEDIKEEKEKMKEKVELDKSNELIEKKSEIEKKEEIIIIKNQNKKMENQKESLINTIENNQISEENEENTNSMVHSLLNNNRNITIYNNNNKSKSCQNIKKILLAIFFGQILSLLCLGNGYFVEEIQKQKKIEVPLLINATYYFLIFFLYFFISKCKIKKPKWIYIILSLLDTQTNFVNIYIFSFIDFRFPYIMNVLSTIWAVVFTLILIRIYKYLLNHILGIILCIIGVFAVFLGTFEKISDFIDIFKSFNDDIKGFLLSILVSILYGLNSVLMEKYISNENDEIKLYCIWLGIFGFGISIIESFIPKDGNEFEFKILFVTKINNIDKYVIIYWILAALFLMAFTALSPFYIQKFSATMFNISLVFTILWSFIIDLICIKKEFKFYWLIILYFIGFIIIIAGTIIFNLKSRIKKNNPMNRYA